MKDKFTFKDIKPLSEPPEEKAKEELFFKILNKKRQCRNITWLDNLKTLSDFMVEDRFYIALNIVKHKGKKTFYRESLIVADKDSILKFLVDNVDINSGYSRPYLITPEFKTNPYYVISISEEASISFQQ